MIEGVLVPKIGINGMRLENLKAFARERGCFSPENRDKWNEIGEGDGHGRRVSVPKIGINGMRLLAPLGHLRPILRFSPENRDKWNETRRGSTTHTQR